MSEKVYLYGKHSLREALMAIKREDPLIIDKIYLTQSVVTDPKIVSLLQSNKFSYSTVTADEIDSMVGKDAIHQGVCAQIKESTLYTPLDRVLQKAKNKSANSLFVLMDELQDSHNVGAIIRSAVAFGADAVLIPEHNQTQITATVIKTSSGMAFAIPIVRIGNINTTLTKLKENGFWTYGLTGDGDTKLDETKFDANTVIVVGGEGVGIRAKTLELCDFKLSIKINSLCESLNASNAAAVTLYEWNKQNN